ncbi:MAG: PAS domain-containing protein [Planctomycetaceae bacterium]|nr:PAS domain-containing protein [Planctomycetaceae bacterium]
MGVSKDAVLILDARGKIVWANRAAHENVSLKPGALLGRNYLDFCPVDTHGDLLRLHRRKLEGETVRFRIDLGTGKVLAVTSGPVKVDGRQYLFVVARRAVGTPAGDEVLLGMVAAGVLLPRKRQKVDLNSLLVGALKDEAPLLRGRMALVPGSPPSVVVRPWPIRMVLRRLLLQAREAGGRFRLATGGDPRRAWVRITMARAAGGDSKELEACRRIAREQGGRLQVRGRSVLLSFPAA